MDTPILTPDEWMDAERGRRVIRSVISSSSLTGASYVSEMKMIDEKILLLDDLPEDVTMNHSDNSCCRFCGRPDIEQLEGCHAAGTSLGSHTISTLFHWIKDLECQLTEIRLERAMLRLEKQQEANHGT